MASLKTYLLWAAAVEKEGREEPLPIENPATGEVYARASAQDVDETVQEAQAAFEAGTWSRAPRSVRAEVLEAAAERLTAALPELIAMEVEQTGRAVREMQAQVPSLVRWFRYYAALLRTEERPVFPTTGQLHNWADYEPLGVVALVTPFNHPLLIAVKKLAPALAAGNSVVLKPSELTPLSSLRLAAVLRDAGLPRGVLSVLPGPGAVTAAALASHPLVRSVDVTGSTAAGRALGAAAGRNLARFNAELGGKAAVVVFGDADVEAAVNGVAFGAFVASGQTCVAASRILVEARLLPAFLAGLTGKARAIAARMAGDPGHPRSAMGPLVSARQLAHVEALVDEAVAQGQARVVVGGQRMTGPSPVDGHDLGRGYFYPPTVLVSDNDADLLQARIWRDEAFGPVVVVVGFPDGDEDRAVALANDGAFGLGGAVWTTDLARAFRVAARVRAGLVWVNTHHRNDPSSPWGPVTASSGVGSENGRDALRAYSQAKSTIVSYAAAADARADDWFGEQEGVRYG